MAIPDNDDEVIGELKASGILVGVIVVVFLIIMMIHPSDTVTLWFFFVVSVPMWMFLNRLARLLGLKP